MGALDPNLVLRAQGYDSSPRWQKGERLSDLFEDRCDALEEEGWRDHLAIESETGCLSYRQLDEAANRLARFLCRAAIGEKKSSTVAREREEAKRIGLLFEPTVERYIALLAVLKAGMAFVPLDLSFPPERLTSILEDAGVEVILTRSDLRGVLGERSQCIFVLDEMEEELARESSSRLPREGRGADDLAYLIYTSGSTGKPKGVEIAHSSICNFVRVASEIYGYRPDDRVYQGMTIAFDFSFEEIFVPLMAGATLIPAPPHTKLASDDLWQFLLERGVTALCVVPTLLATLAKDLPSLRLLLISGEACPADLVRRWYREGRTLLNLYGPTETTVTASWTVLHPEKPVTIGVPLPTYSMVILDPEMDRVLPRGEIGEIGIGGIGLARGYWGRPELTAQKFIPDFLGLPDNPSKRIYRTGDLGRIQADGEIEFLGRIDTQVKIRGYRIELTEIESLLLAFPEIEEAVVHPYVHADGTKELVAYYTLRSAGSLPPEQIAATLSHRLPPYMVPSYYEELHSLPRLASGKVDRKALPPPSGSRMGRGDLPYLPPSTPEEAKIAEVLCEVLGLSQVSVTADFFKDLGAHSLLMAGFCARLRADPRFASISMRDVYQYPTVERLARALPPPSNVVGSESKSPAMAKVADRPSRLGYLLCGCVQALFYLLYATLHAGIAFEGWRWVLQSATFAEGYGRIVFYSLSAFLLLSLLPIAAKWLLVGRWKEGSIPLWSLSYLRFWVVKELLRHAPPVFWKETLLYHVYLRALGAKVGWRSLLLSRTVPLATDLLHVGDETVLAPETLFTGYRARHDQIEIGSITIGKECYVGEGSVLEIGSRMEDGSELAHASCVAEGQILRSGRAYHGSPAVEAPKSFRPLSSAPSSLLRRVLYTGIVLGMFFGVYTPLLWGGLIVLSHSEPWNTLVPYRTLEAMMADPWGLLLQGGWVAFQSYLLFLGGALGTAILAPRILSPFLREGVVYPLFSFPDYLRTLLYRLSNIHFNHVIFGDSSAIVYYLRLLGFDLGTIIQTGSNFGTEQRYDAPTLCSVGSGTMVADGLFLHNLELSASSFRLRRVRVGESCYLGNHLHIPPSAKIGNNCLVGTKTMVPVYGEIRSDIGLLGSPSFLIPRAVERDLREAAAFSEEERRARLHQKNLHNLGTALFYLGWNGIAFAISFFFVEISDLLCFEKGVVCWMASFSLYACLLLLWYVLGERLSLGFGRLEPGIFSILDRRFWVVERHWKMSESVLKILFPGTPFRAWLLRLLGCRVGTLLYDDGCDIPDKTLVTIGDRCCLNVGTTLQSHSLEEGVFKSGPIHVGDRCTLGLGSFVHYGTTMKEGSELRADAFLMKGETMEEGSSWQGNPARLLSGSEVFNPPSKRER